MKLLKNLAFIILVLLLAYGVNTFLYSKWRMELSKERMDRKNQTEYIFNSSIRRVKEVIERDLKKTRYMELYRENPPCKDSVIAKQMGKNDYILSNSLDMDMESFVYRTGQRGRYYFMSLLLKLDSLSEGQTRIKIVTDNARIISGYRLGLTPMSFAHGCFIIPIFQNVEPSTIEEYQVIYKIGRGLGEKMVPVVYPASLSKEMIRETYYAVGPGFSDQTPWFETVTLNLWEE